MLLLKVCPQQRLVEPRRGENNKVYFTAATADAPSDAKRRRSRFATRGHPGAHPDLYTVTHYTLNFAAAHGNSVC